MVVTALALSLTACAPTGPDRAAACAPLLAQANALSVPSAPSGEPAGFVDVYDSTAPSLYRTSWAVQAVDSEGWPSGVERAEVADFLHAVIVDPMAISAAEPYSELAAVRLAWAGLRALNDARSVDAVAALDRYEAGGRYAETPGGESTTYADFLAAEILRGEGATIPRRMRGHSGSGLPPVIPRVAIAQTTDGLLVDLRAAALTDPDALLAAHPELAERVSGWTAEVVSDGFGIAQLSTLMDLRGLAEVTDAEFELPAGYVADTLAAVESGSGGIDPHIAALLRQLDPADESPLAELRLAVGATPRGWLGATTPPDVASNLRGLILLELCDATSTEAAGRAESYLNAHLDAAPEWTALDAYAAARLDRAGSLASGVREVASERVRAIVAHTPQEGALLARARVQFAEAADGESASQEPAAESIVDLASEAIIHGRAVGEEQLTPFSHAEGYTYERSGEVPDLYSTAIGACLLKRDGRARQDLLAGFEDPSYPDHYALTSEARPSLASAALAAALLFADDCSLALAVYG